MKHLVKIYGVFSRSSFYLLIITVIFASFCYSAISVVRHMHFESGAFDLGIFDQAVWQFSHFLIPFNTIKMRIILGDHFSPILILLAPLYWIWSDVRMLLIFQSVWVSSSAIPIFLYLKKKTFSSFGALSLSIIYLFYFGFQYGIYFDFHPIMLAVGILSWMAYFWGANKWKLFWLFGILLLLTQENMALAFVGFALCFVMQKKHLRKVLFIFIVSSIYIIIARYLIAVFNHGINEYNPYFPISPAGYILQFFDAQEKRQVWLYSFGWFSFLPIFSPGACAAVLLNLFQYFVIGQSAYYSPFTHHHALLGIFLLIGAADALLFLKRKKIAVPIVLLFIVPFCLQLSNHFVLNNLSKYKFYSTQPWMLDNYKLLKMVPENVSIAAQESLVPHLSQRNYIYLLYPVKKDFKNAKIICGQVSCWWVDFAGTPQLLIVDLHPNEWLTMTLAQSADFSNAIANMEKNHVIRLKEKVGDARMYYINYESLKTIQ